MFTTQTIVRHIKKKTGTKGIFISEGGFTVKNITSETERAQAFRLRHRIFAEELGWVPVSKTLIEKDKYDGHSTSIGVFDKRHNIVALARIVLPGTTFMIEKEFSSLVGSWHTVRKQKDTAEVSRLCVLPEARNISIDGNFGVHGVTMFLYKGIFQWCTSNNVRYIYVVVESKIHRMFCAKGFPCRAVGEPLVMSDGCVAIAAMIDFKELVSINTEKRPLFTTWFTQDELNHIGLQLQPPVFYLQPGASA